MTVSIQFLLLTVLALVGCVIVFVTIYTRLRHQYDALVSSYRDLERLNSDLRAQRHDYLNHLQVVYGLMELEEYDELKTYLAPIYKGMMKTGKALKTKNPAVNALLRAKMEEAESKGIDFYVEVTSDLSGLKAEPWELCKVLANLMDNAITALEAIPSEKKLRVDIGEDRDSYRFSVANNGPAIPEELQESIFREGFTTKKESGHGMGLSIVTQVLKTYKGTISLSSTEEETVFRIRIPKSNQK
ncbi:MAG: Spo0B domain-containing protein [Oscillospiraceae bacterium]|nr:Spo0B domain-containing protein [Oscillospiraceae bacterium]